MGVQFNPNEHRTVEDLYTKGLNRQADQGGLDYWKSQFGDYVDANEFNTFKTAAMPEYNATQAQKAQEYQASPAGAENTDWLRSQYQSLLGRAPDTEGLNYWSSQLQNGSMTRDQIINAFKQSPEFQERNAPPPPVNPSTAPGTNPYGINTPNPYASSQDPYIQATQQQALANLAAAQTATAANRVNQTTPFGSVNFQQTGVDAAGNPIWSANQTLSPAFQPALSNIQQNIARQTATPFDVSATQQQMANMASPAFQNVGPRPELQTSLEGTGMQGWDKANEIIMSRLAPRMQQLDEALDAKLANRGIMPGTEAYNRAKLALNQSNNDLTLQAQLAGAQLQNQQFQQNLAAGEFRNKSLTGQNVMDLANVGFNNQTSQQGFLNQMAQLAASNQARQGNFQQNLTAYNNPLQQLAAFREGTAPNYVNYFNQATTQGPNYFDAYATANAQSIAAQNAALAAAANQQAGLYGLGSAALLGSGGIGGLWNLGKDVVKGVGGIYDWVTGLF